MEVFLCSCYFDFLGIFDIGYPRDIGIIGVNVTVGTVYVEFLKAILVFELLCDDIFDPKVLSLLFRLRCLILNYLLIYLLLTFSESLLIHIYKSSALRLDFL